MKLKDFFNVLRLRFISIGVPGIIQNSKGEILLGKRSKLNPFYPNKWGLPGGVIDYGETLEEALKREVFEEMGVKIKILKKSKNIYESVPDKKSKGPKKIHSLTIPFYAKITKGKPKPLDETTQIKWFKPSEIKKMKLAYSQEGILKKEGILK